MSVSNVNSIYGAQMGSNAGYDTPAIKIEEKESNIGAWLCGGLALVATLGVGIAAHKSGKAIASNDDNMFQTIWKGVKSWVGKNGDDVAKNIDDIPAECKTSFKTFFSGGEITSEQKQNIVDNADEISKVFTNKARKNATKATRLAEIGDISDSNKKAEALADFFGVEKKLKITNGKLDTTGLSLDDQAIIDRKLKNGDESITGNNIDDIIKGLQNKYKTKHENYDDAVEKIKDIRVKDIREDSDVFSDTTIAKRLNRAGAAQTLAGSCEDTSSYINTQNSLTKWRDAGDLTQDEYDNLMALAENNFIKKNSENYLNYMTQGLMKKDGKNAINLKKLEDGDVSTLKAKFSWLNLSSDATSLSAETFVAQRKASATSISEYLGLNGCSLSSKDANGFKLVDGKLVWEASAGRDKAPTAIFGKEIDTTNCEITQKGETTTKIKLTMKNIKEILNPSVPPTPPPTTPT